MHVSKKFIKKVRRKYKRISKVDKLKIVFIFCLIGFVGTSLIMKTHGKKPINNNKLINKVDKNEKNVKEKITIVIDPGHGKKADMTLEPGAPGFNFKRVKAPLGCIGNYSKTPEYVINYCVSLKLKAILEKKGFNVVVTKNDILENPGGRERAEVGNKANARLVVRIHADSFKDEAAKGTTLIIPAPINETLKKISVESDRCAKIILESLILNAGVKSRGIITKRELTAFNWSTVPTLLIEMGFLSNREEDMLLNTEEYQNKLAEAIAIGIEQAVKE